MTPGGIGKYGSFTTTMMRDEFKTVRLLGGSHHGKKMQIGSIHGPLVMRKKPKPRRWIPHLDDSDYFFTIEEEVYERKTMHKCISCTGTRWVYEVRTAYVKKGSKIKEGTFWKLGIHCDTYERWNG